MPILTLRGNSACVAPGNRGFDLRKLRVRRGGKFKSAVATPSVTPSLSSNRPPLYLDCDSMIIPAARWPDRIAPSLSRAGWSPL